MWIGGITAEHISKEAIAGSDIVLTIDANLQKVTEEALEANIKKISSGGFGRAFETEAGACVVMNANTGEVLAMASYPEYNPADFVGGISNEAWAGYMNNEAKPLVNKAMQNSYAPGSIFKMVTAIAGLESGVINLNTTINDTGVYSKYPDALMRCWIYTETHRGHGWVNVSAAIEKSCNYFFYETSDRMGIDQLVRFAKYFGLGGKTGIELQGEASGILASREKKAEINTRNPAWTAGDTLNASIGQGLNEFTPLQMARYISILANGGNNVDVSIVKTIRNPNGSESSREEINNFVNRKLGIGEQAAEEDINKNYLNAVLEGMKSVTSDTRRNSLC